ncbi:hypothetical protein F5Y12DRAFT_730638 [Xylaria sp. FL1777]|nr:hypothetical protein F5Y12DRAFT_730638 [Xylaria sp. FL1777]
MRDSATTYGTQGPPIEICRNQIATRRWCTHRVVWGGEGDEGDQAAWVRSLRPGNVILVKPMVMFPGWQNWVLRVTVDVYTSCLRYSEEEMDI